MATLEQWTAVRDWTLTILWWICWPVGILVYYLAVLVLTVLRTLARPVGFLLQPVVYLGRFVLACVIAPVRLLAKLETLYIYLGVAAITGVVTGLVASYIYGWLAGFLHLNLAPEQQQPPPRSAKEYRDAKRKHQAAAVEAPLVVPGSLAPQGIAARTLSPVSPSASDGSRKGKRGANLLNQVIMEEDSDF